MDTIRSGSWQTNRVLPGVGRGQANPVDDALRGAAELARQLGRGAPGVHEIDHLLPELGRIGDLDMHA